jgi:hypothetical protein
MQRHIENTFELTDVYKKIENWAKDNDFNETKSTATKESFNFTFTKNYGKFLQLKWGILISLLFIGSIFGMIYENKYHPRELTELEKQREYLDNLPQEQYSTGIEALQGGLNRGILEGVQLGREFSASIDEITNPAPQKTAAVDTILLAILFPGIYIAYYNYQKNRGMKFCVNINTIRVSGKTDIQISSKSDFQELKNDIAKLYNAFI